MHQAYREPTGVNFASSALESLVHRSGVINNRRQQSSRDKRQMAEGAVEAQPGRSGANAMIHFLGAIYANLEVDRLRDSYFEAIPGLVTASAYEVCLLDSPNAYHIWLAAPVAPARSFTGDNERQRAAETPYMQVVDIQEAANPNRLFSDHLRHYQPLQEFVDVRRLSRFARIPIIGGCGELAGVLGFARTSSQRAFGHDDLGIIQMVAHHMGVAIDHARIHTEVRQRIDLIEATFRMFASSVVLKEDEAENKPANFQAQERVMLSDPDMVFQTVVTERCPINHQLDLIESSTRINPGTARSSKQALALGDCSGHQTIHNAAVRLGATALLSGLDLECNSQQLISTLSRREIEVLMLLSQGLRNQDIAEGLQITLNTVKHHLKNIFQKMQVNSRSELRAKAFPGLARR